MFTTEDSYAPFHQCCGRASGCRSTAVQMPLLPEYCRECAVTLCHAYRHSADNLLSSHAALLAHICPHSIPQRCRHCAHMVQSCRYLCSLMACFCCQNSVIHYPTPRMSIWVYLVLWLRCLIVLCQIVLRFMTLTRNECIFFEFRKIRDVKKFGKTSKFCTT